MVVVGCGVKMYELCWLASTNVAVAQPVYTDSVVAITSAALSDSDVSVNLRCAR